MQESFEIAFDTYRRAYKYSINDAERKIISKLVREGEIPLSELDDDSVRMLVNSTFVIKDDEKRVYRINGGLFKRVIAEYF